MDVINKLIKLVGLEYYMSIEQREEFFKSWSHNSILIKPDKENPKDKTALRITGTGTTDSRQTNEPTYLSL